MNRRTFLSSATIVSGFLSGCSTDPTSPVTATSSPPAPSPSTPIPTPTRTPLEHPNTIFVAPSGSASNPGTNEAPLDAVQTGLERARPGDVVRLAPGEYQQGFRTVRHGSAEAPITVTGPPSAVVRNEISIRHSHIHLRGITVTGLLKPDEPNRLSSYEEGTLIMCRPSNGNEAYLRDVVIAPSAIGHVWRNLIGVVRSRNVEIGPFRVIGLAGAQYVIGDKRDHAGEIVYLGQPPSTVERGGSAYPWDEIDQTRAVHVHHIDNSAGHPHSEIVNAKIGTRDILIEYCTDGGGSQNNEESSSASIRLESYDATVRWCDLRDGHGYGIHITAANERWLKDRNNPPIDPDIIGSGHALYGNRVAGFGDHELVFDFTGPREQAAICENGIDEMYVRPPEEGKPIKGYPEKPCPDGVPAGDGVGHAGGNSPWD